MYRDNREKYKMKRVMGEVSHTSSNFMKSTTAATKKDDSMYFLLVILTWNRYRSRDHIQKS
jgi:hypothetical protein